MQHSSSPTLTTTATSNSDIQPSSTVNNHASSQGTNAENDDADGWHLVGTFKTTTADVRHYYVVPSKINIDQNVRR